MDGILSSIFLLCKMDYEIIINGFNIHNKASLYKEINRVFMQNEDWQIGENLDALNDLLHGGFGILKDHQSVTIIWENFNDNKNLFGYPFTLQFYKDKLKQPTTFNSAFIITKIKALKRHKGPTYFDSIVEIFTSKANIKLIKA